MAFAAQFRQTGAIWKVPPARRRKIVDRICKALEKRYGLPRLDNPEDPLDDLVFISISNKTPPERAKQVFDAIKREFPTWDEALDADSAKLEALMRPAGLVGSKLPRLRAALTKIRADFGRCTLEPLAKLPEKVVLEYLTSLPSVSGKVARCVMMYTLGALVLPVDVHVHRVASRLGWTNRLEPRQAHDELEALVTPKRRYAFHVDCVAHGRAVCRPSNPRCDSCPITSNCVYYAELVKMGRFVTCSRREDST